MYVRSLAFVGSNGGAWDDGHSFWYVLMLISEADATSIFTVASFNIRLTVKELLGRRPRKHQLSKIVVSDSVAAVSGVVSGVVT